MVLLNWLLLLLDTGDETLPAGSTSYTVIAAEAYMTYTICVGVAGGADEAKCCEPVQTPEESKSLEPSKRTTEKGVGRQKNEGRR